MDKSKKKHLRPFNINVACKSIKKMRLVKTYPIPPPELAVVVVAAPPKMEPLEGGAAELELKQTNKRFMFNFAIFNLAFPVPFSTPPPPSHFP